MEFFAQSTLKVSGKKNLKGLNLPLMKYTHSPVDWNEAQTTQKE